MYSLNLIYISSVENSRLKIVFFTHVHKSKMTSKANTYMIERNVVKCGKYAGFVFIDDFST